MSRRGYKRRLPLVDQKERRKKARLESASFLAKRATSVEDALDTLDEDFPISKRICTFSVFLQTQLYAVMENGSRTLVDRVVDEKRRANQIRVVQLGTCTSQSGLCLTEDLIKYLKKLTVVDPKKQRIITNFCDKLMPAVTKSHVSKGEIAKYVHDNMTPPLEDTITFLIHRGLLRIRDKHYLFTIPNSSFIWKYVRDARKEIAQILRRQKYGEMSVVDLLSTKLKNTALPVKFHLLDVLGQGFVVIRTNGLMTPTLRLISEAVPDF